MSFYDDASWLLIPSGIEEDVVYAQKPTSGLGDLNFQRASDATYTDASGVVRRSPYNLLQQSETFNNAVWISDNTTTVTANADTAPNGTLTADRLQMSISQRRYIYQTITPTQTTYTYSVYLRANSNQTVRISVDQGCANYRGGLICNVTTQWQRFSLTVLNVVVSSGAVAVVIDNITSNTNACTGTAVGVDIFAWGAQLVEGNSALDYFPTTNRQDVPRIDFRNADGTLSSCGRLLLEPQRTNSIRNSSMVGAVAGSPGILPTNWIMSALAGLTQTVVGSGTENGLPYIDLRFNGTASASSLRFTTDASTAIAALPSQIWSNSSYFKLTAGTLSQITLRNIYRNSGGGAISTPQQQFDLTATLTRRTFTDAAAPALTAFVQQEVFATLVIGQTYDFTIRIAAPQMELGNFATTWVPTTTAAVTRLADSASKTGVSSLIGQTEGTMFVDVNALGGLSNQSYLMIWDGTSNNRVAIFSGGTGQENRLAFYVSTGGVSQVAFTTAVNYLGVNKIALAYKLNDVVAYVNGVQIFTDTSATVPATNTIQISVSPTNVLNAGIAQAALFPTRLSNSELQSLTTL